MAIRGVDIPRILREHSDAWDLFTRAEEYREGHRDRYDRFPYYLSRSRDIFEPVASRVLFEHGCRWEYPKGSPFAVFLSHDIDIVYESFLSTLTLGAKALKDRQWRHLRGHISALPDKRRPWVNFAEIAALEEEYGARSTFFFQALTEGDQDFCYHIEDFDQEIAALSDGGWDIGLHGGHEAYRSLAEVKTELHRLEKVVRHPVVSYRNHFLRFRVPDTWEILREAGLKVDSTLGYADCCGFRNGMCHPFVPFNLATDRPIDILEIPLVVMDLSLFARMSLDQAKAWDLFTRIAATVERYQGVLSVLWHNTCIYGEYRSFYENILNHCRAKGAWMTSAAEIERWWNEDGAPMQRTRS